MSKFWFSHGLPIGNPPSKRGLVCVDAADPSLAQSIVFPHGEPQWIMVSSHQEKWTACIVRFSLHHHNSNSNSNGNGNSNSNSNSNSKNNNNNSIIIIIIIIHYQPSKNSVETMWSNSSYRQSGKWKKKKHPVIDMFSTFMSYHPRKDQNTYQDIRFNVKDHPISSNPSKVPPSGLHRATGWASSDWPTLPGKPPQRGLPTDHLSGRLHSFSNQWMITRQWISCTISYYHLWTS